MEVEGETEVVEEGQEQEQQPEDQAIRIAPDGEAEQQPADDGFGAEFVEEAQAVPAEGGEFADGEGALAPAAEEAPAGDSLTLCAAHGLFSCIRGPSGSRAT